MRSRTYPFGPGDAKRLRAAWERSGTPLTLWLDDQVLANLTDAGQLGVGVDVALPDGSVLRVGLKKRFLRGPVPRLVHRSIPLEGSADDPRGSLRSIRRILVFDAALQALYVLGAAQLPEKVKALPLAAAFVALGVAAGFGALRIVRAPVGAFRVALTSLGLQAGLMTYFFVRTLANGNFLFALIPILLFVGVWRARSAVLEQDRINVLTSDGVLTRLGRDFNLPPGSGGVRSHAS